MRYEDLLVDPRGELAALCRFLDEPFDEAMLDHATAAGDIVPRRKTWHDLTHGALDISRVDAWRTSLAPEEIGLVEIVGRNTMRRHGYQVSGIAERPPTTEVLRCLRNIERRTVGMYKRRAADAMQRRRDVNPLAYQA
jgi:hypothetical protein